MADYYQILGVDKKASNQEIKSAFKKLALQHHPDRNPGNPLAEEKFKLINEAYQVLSHADEKSLYDLKLNGQYIPHVPVYPPYRSQQEYTYKQEQSRPQYAAPTYTKEQIRKVYAVGVAFFVVLFIFSYFLNNFMNKKTAKIHYANAIRYTEENKLYLAVSEINQALYFDEEYAQAYQKRGELQLLAGQSHRYAYADFNKAIQYAQPATPEMYFFRGLCLYRMGKYAQAIEDCKQAYVENELKGPAVFLQGAARKALQDIDGACKDWQQAQTLGVQSAKDSIGVNCQEY